MMVDLLVPLLGSEKATVLHDGKKKKAKKGKKEIPQDYVQT